MATILIHNVTVLDLLEHGKKPCDLWVENGKLQQIRPANSLKGADCTVDGTGCYATSGWLDAHAHLYVTDSTIGVDGSAMLKDGVTLAVDAGTAGPGNFEDFRTNTMERAKIREKAYLNLAYMGLDRRFGELQDLGTVSPEKCCQIIQTYPDCILGLKLRIDPRVCRDPEGALELASEVSSKTGKPFVVHPSRCQLPIEQILSHMKKGDIYAHSFANKAPGILDEKGQVKQAVLEARARGVLFDLSHGNGNFSFQVAKKALAQGFAPDAISTDLHTGSREKVQSLALVMSKMLACGMDLWTVLDLVTWKAAELLGLPSSRTLQEGETVNLTLFQVKEGNFQFFDSDGMPMDGKQLIEPIGTIFGGKVCWNPEYHETDGLDK